MDRTLDAADSLDLQEAVAGQVARAIDGPCGALDRVAPGADGSRCRTTTAGRSADAS